MALQRVFKKGYIEYLKTHIQVSNYLLETFPVDCSQVVPLYGTPHPEGLAERVVPTRQGDFATAVAIYEAYRNISPLFAQQGTLWVYLSHTELFDYFKRRWPILTKERDTEEKQASFIADHWFLGDHGIIRSALMGLWWAVYCTIDTQRENQYELTEVLFSNYSFRNSYFGASLIFRHREAAIGVLGFLKENPDVFANNSETRGEFITRYFNQLGGVKQLASLNRDFFSDECERIKPKIMAVTQREHVQNTDVLNTVNS